MTEPSTPRTGWVSTNATPKSSSKWAKFQERLHHYSSKSNNSSPPNPQRNTAKNAYDSNVGLDRPFISSSSSLSSVTQHQPDPPYLVRNSSNSRNISTPSTLSVSTSKSSDIRFPSPSLAMTPPKVEPFISSKSAINSSRSTPSKARKTLINAKCCFCDELMTSRLSSEKIIELNCGDICHEECLYLLLDFDNSDKNGDPYYIFPLCETCHKQALPSDESITNSIISRYLLSSPSPGITQTNNLTSTDSLIISSSYQLPTTSTSHRDQNFLDSPLMPPSLQSQPPFDTHHYGDDSSTSSSPIPHNKYQPMSLANKNSKDLSIHIPDRPFSRSHYHSRSRSKTSKSRGSSISAISSIVSSVPKSPSPTLSSFDNGNTLNSINDEDGKISLALLRSEYISDLVKKLQDNYDSNLKESDVDSFGLLRLVDVLKISETGEKFKELVTYLFQYNIVLVNSSYSRVLSYGIPKTPKIKTPNSSTLKVSLGSEKSLYITHDSNKVLQKWIAGLCDYDFVFNIDNLSSTVKLGVDKESEIVSLNSDYSDSIVGQSIQGDDGADDVDDDGDIMTLPVLLSPMRIQDNNDDETPVVRSAPNSIRFEKKDRLILIVDHDSKSLISSESLTTLKNIAKVLAVRFKEFNLIYSNDFTQVLKTGNASAIEFIGSTTDTITQHMNIHERIKTIISGDSDSYALLIITNSIISNESVTSLPILNQLIINIQTSQQPGSDLKGNNVIKLGSWDKIMEALINRLELDFTSDVVGDEEDLDSDEFDSDAFETDIDSDIEGENFSSDKEEVTATGRQEEEMSENETQFDDNRLDEINTSPISSDNNIQMLKSPMVSINNSGVPVLKIVDNPNRWSVLFKDIDIALAETKLDASEES